MNDIIQKSVERVQQGDRTAYKVIINTYKDQIYNLCYRHLGNHSEAEEAAQEAFVRAYLNIDTVRLDLKFSSWLFRIATNICIDRLRKKKPDVYLDAEIEEGMDYYSQIPAQIYNPEEQLLKREVQTTVQKAIDRLPEKYRSAIILRYLNHLSLKEICTVLGLPIGTVKTRIHRGREELKKYLTYE